MVKMIERKKMKFILLVVILLVSQLILSCSEDVKSDMAGSNSPVKELKIIDHVIGDGTAILNNHRAAVHYTGWLYDETAEDKKGKKFDSSHDRKRPFIFNVGNKDVIEGWEKGMLGMNAGGKRTLIIPPHMAYGEKGAGNSIPPNAALIFDIDLLQAR